MIKYISITFLILFTILFLKFFEIDLFGKDSFDKSMRDYQGARLLEALVGEYYDANEFPVPVDDYVHLEGLRSIQGVLIYDYAFKEIVSTNVSDEMLEYYNQRFDNQVESLCDKIRLGAAGGLEKFNFTIRYNLLGADNKNVFSVKKYTGKC